LKEAATMTVQESSTPRGPRKSFVVPPGAKILVPAISGVDRSTAPVSQPNNILLAVMHQMELRPNLGKIVKKLGKKKDGEQLSAQGFAMNLAINPSSTQAVRLRPSLMTTIDLVIFFYFQCLYKR
jgi:hypothetical protein